MKKFLSLLLVLTMLISAFPMATVTMAETSATTDVKLYDVHITGNVVFGGTLTAKFEPADSDAALACRYSKEETIKTIKWSARCRYGSQADHYITEALAIGTDTYTIPDTWKNKTPKVDYAYGIFFTVQPMDDDGNPIGEVKYYSSITAEPKAVNNAVDKPVACNAHISPLNGDNEITFGKTVSANYSFQYLGNASVNEQNSRYTWYASENLLENGDLADEHIVQSDSTKKDYTIKPDDAGKWIYVKIVPVASNGKEGDAVYARNHLENAFLSPDANMHSINQSTDTTTHFYPSETDNLSGYPYVKMLADGYSNTNIENDVSTFLFPKSKAIGKKPSFIVDAGKQVSFDAVYLEYGSSISALTITYSTDKKTWEPLDTTGYKPGLNEFEYEEVKTARYFKLAFTTGSTTRVRVYEFYPFLKEVPTITTTIEFTKSSFAKLNGKEIEVQAWGTPLSEVKKAENGFKVVSPLDAEDSTTNADRIASDASFVTSDGDGYTPVANPENIKVNENLENTYLKVNDGKTVQYYLVKYAGHIAQTEDEVITSASGTTGNDIYPVGTVDLPYQDGEGYAIGKYLLKTQVKLPSSTNTTTKKGVRTTIGAYQSTISEKAADIANIVTLNGYNDTTWGFPTQTFGIKGDGGEKTGYSFNLEQWLNLEILFDFDSTTKGSVAEGENETINIKIWADSILIADYAAKWNNPSTYDNISALKLSPRFILYPNKAGDDIYHKNSSFRQVWSADTHVVENDYDLKIVNSDAADVEATTLTAGNYTATTNMKVYKGSSLVTYIAKYYVNGDTKELMDVANASSASKNYVTVTEDELANNTVELKAITFSYLTDSLYPQFVSKSLKSN